MNFGKPGVIAAALLLMMSVAANATDGQGAAKESWPTGRILNFGDEARVLEFLDSQEMIHPTDFNEWQRRGYDTYVGLLPSAVLEKWVRRPSFEMLDDKRKDQFLLQLLTPSRLIEDRIEAGSPNGGFYNFVDQDRVDRISILRNILSTRPEIADRLGSQLLLHAVNYGNIRGTKMLMQMGVKPSGNVLQFALASRRNLKYRYRVPLISTSEQAELVGLLVKAGAPINPVEGDASPLATALGAMYREDDCEPDASKSLPLNRGDLGGTPRFAACPSNTHFGNKSDALKSVELLLKRGARFRPIELDVVSKSWLEGRGLLECVALLEKYGFDFSEEYVAVKKSKPKTPSRASRLARKSTPESLKDCPDCPEMVVLPQGRFTMGSSPSETGRSGSESPRHDVGIQYKLAVGKYAVTFDNWQSCVNDGGCQSNTTPGDSGWGRGNRPVINISWDDAQEYVAWLKSKTGKNYRLLTESEWEFSARAGESAPFHTGSCINATQANYDSGVEYKGCEKKGERRAEKTVPVGSYGFNNFGLYDMAGNVWNWVEDCFHENYVGAPEDGSAWVVGCNKGLRMIRGGSWSYDARFLRSASRDMFNSSSANNDIGFRVARTF
jgi:formylglycine-generating enzyme required for sulfatase activity